MSTRVPARRPLLQDAADVCGRLPIREYADTELVLVEEVERLGFCQTRDVGHDHRQSHRQRERDRRIDDHARPRRWLLRQHRSYRLPRFLAPDCAARQLRVTEECTPYNTRAPDRGAGQDRRRCRTERGDQDFTSRDLELGHRIPPLVFSPATERANDKSRARRECTRCTYQFR